MKMHIVTRQFWMISAALIAAITLQLVTPIIARADDGTPPPPATDQVAPTETPPSQSQDTTTIPSTSDESSEIVHPMADGTNPSVSDQAASTETSTSSSENGVAAPPAGDGSSDVVPAVEDAIVSALPENVDLVVVGADGQPEALASQDAANALSNSDPFWCPDGTDPVGGGCTSYATFTALLAGLQSVGSLTNGTVYVQEGVYGGPEGQITFNGNTLTNIGNLGLIGGWDLAAATPSQIGVTTFNVPISIINWTHDVSVQDIVVDGATGSGLTITTSGGATATNVTAVNNSQDGVHIDAGDSVNLQNILASNNGDDGVDIRSNTNTGTITLDDVRAYANTNDGIHIYSKQKSNITLTNITSAVNSGDGLDLQSPVETAAICEYMEGGFIPAGTIGVAFPYADIPGPTLVVYRICHEPIRQQLAISNADFSNNGGNGMYISTTGDFRIGVEFGGTPPGIVIAPVTANNNRLNGAYINIFASAPPPFPWAYYQARARQLAGGPASVFALDDASQRETIPLVDTSTTLLTNNNQGQNYVYQTDAPGTWCEVTATSVSCVSPPGVTPIMGGEMLDLSSNSAQSSTQSGSGSTPLCANNSIIILQLPNNDNVTVFCPISGQISVKSLTKKGLPATAPDGTTFVSALNVALSKDGKPTSVITEGGHLKVSFAIPSDLAGKSFAIMFWDAAGGKWVELPAFTADGSGKALSTPLHPDNPGDGMQVLEGTNVLADVGLVEASVNFSGIFMLVTK